MARYDSPGHVDTLPGVGSFDARAGTAAGSDGAAVRREAPEAAEVLGHPVITTPHSSSQVAADNPTTPVTRADVNVPGQVPEQEPFTGVGNTWRESFPGPGGPSAHVATPPHPGAARLPS